LIRHSSIRRDHHGAREKFYDCAGGVDAQRLNGLLIDQA